jgi:glycosyltransferase involved in cell wall biosynthesis
MLSTHNGERYLPSQLDSLLAQRGADVLIDVRDDGSKDASPDIIDQYACEHSRIRHRRGVRLGAAASFFDLLKHADRDSACFAFCDQDDVWYPDKIARAVDKLASIGDVPALYCSRLEYVDADLNRVGFSRLPRRPLSFMNALAENVAIGCTMVLNNRARALVLESLPAACVMHDWWCYLTIAAFGVVVYDDQPMVKYRLHGSNEVGAPISPADNLSRRMRRFLARGHAGFNIHAQAQAFKTACGPRLGRPNAQVLDRFLASRLSLRSRVAYALSKDIYRQSKVDDLLLRALIVWNWY